MFIENKLERQTRLIELVETGNISRSIKRIMRAPGYDRKKWKYAIVHAMHLAECYDNEIEKVRQAFELP